jgi:hypothetical protein
MWGEVDIGSNLICNTSGVVFAEANEGREPLFSVEAGESDRQLLLSVEVHDPDGSLAARLRRNTWVFNDGDRFGVAAAPGVVKVVHQGSGTVVLEAEALGDDRVRIPQGDIYTPAGFCVEIRADRVVIGTTTFRDMRLEGEGHASIIVVGPASLSVCARP